MTRAITFFAAFALITSAALAHHGWGSYDAAKPVTVTGPRQALRDALMTEAAPAIFVALEGSSFAAAIRQSLWLYPAANVGHIVSLFVFAGAVAVMDVRLLGGFAATAPARLIGRARWF